MTSYSDQFPVIIGVGQVVDHWDGNDAEAAPNPVSLMAKATKAALSDTGQAGAVSEIIDIVCAIRTNEDSLPMKRFPFKMCERIPLAVAEQTGLKPTRAIYSKLGGEQPQRLVNEWATTLYESEAKAVLITGGEAISAMKLAIKTGQKSGLAL